MQVTPAHTHGDTPADKLRRLARRALRRERLLASALLQSRAPCCERASSPQRDGSLGETGVSEGRESAGEEAPARTLERFGHEKQSRVRTFFSLPERGGAGPSASPPLLASALWRARVAPPLSERPSRRAARPAASRVSERASRLLPAIVPCGLLRSSARGPSARGTVKGCGREKRKLPRTLAGSSARGPSARERRGGAARATPRKVAHGQSRHQGSIETLVEFQLN